MRKAAVLLALAAVVPAGRAAWDNGWQRDKVQALFLAETPFVETLEEWRVSASFLGLRRGTARISDWALRMDYGVTERIQARATIPHRTIRLAGGGRSSGLSDPGVEILYDVARVTSDIPLAAYGGATLPTGDEDKGLGRGSTVASGGLRTAWAISASVTTRSARPCRSSM